MSTLRQELMSNLYRQDEERAKMAKRISGIEQLLVASNHLYSQQHDELRGESIHINISTSGMILQVSVCVSASASF